MKKMLLATALALLCKDVLNRRLLFQNKPAMAPRKPSPIISSFPGDWAKKTVDAAKICVAQEMLLKQEPANIRKWIAQFQYFRHLYSAGSACVLLTIIA